MTTTITIPQEILDHWAFNAIPAETRQHVIDFITNPNPSWEIISQDEANPGHLMLDFTASDLLGMHDAPFYSGTPAAIVATSGAARYSTRTHVRFHPWAKLASALETASMLVIAGDPDETHRWLQKRRILESVPMGHHTDVAYHHLLQLFHITMAALTGHSKKPAPNIHTVARKLDNLVHSHTKPNTPLINIADFHFQLGLRVWAEAMFHQQQQPNLHRCNFELTPVTKAINDLYLTPPLFWVRTAFAAINTRAGHTELLDPKHLPAEKPIEPRQHAS